MDLTVGTILEGTVTGITKFGAFVSFPSGRSGLVHISEIAYPYVQNVSDHLKEGQIVKVKVIGIDETGRINLSIKRLEEPPRRPAPAQGGLRPARQAQPRHDSESGESASVQASSSPISDTSFEDKLKRFMQDSDNKMSGVKQYADRKTSSQQRRRKT
jgi:S1 RNA binding domain protein